MSANKLSERMRDFDRQMRPEFETSFIAGWADEVSAMELELAQNAVDRADARLEAEKKRREAEKLSRALRAMGL